MGTNILTNARILVGAYDVSGDMNAVKLTTSADLKDDTAFGATYKTMKGGGALITTKLSGSGFVQSGTGAIEDILEGYLATDNVLISVAGEGGDVGEGVNSFQGVFGAYDAGAKIGDLHQLNYSADNSRNSAIGASNPLVRGTIMEDGKTTRTTAGNTVTQTLGAVASGKKLYCGLHLISFVGTDVTFAVKSAVTDFATLTTRATFTQNTTTGYEYLSPVAGPITDTFYRIYWTTVGGFTSFKAFIVLGIQ